MAFDFEHTELTELTPKIAVIGVGGAGCNAVNNMIAANLQGVDFIVANTDAQSLAASQADNRIQLGVQITQGLGAGAMPKVGAAAAEEAIENIDTMLEGCHMAFITAGMGGGTGTGAAPVIAKRARDKGILTVGVVTKPFHFEGGRRMKVADIGMQELTDHVDTLIVIPNQNLFHVANEKTTFADAFKMADDVLHSGVRGITDLMVMDGLINLDFADVRTVMNEMGKAMMGTGEAGGEGRAVDAAAMAISNPLLEEASLRGARGVIINVTGGMDMTLYEVDEAVNMVREQVDQEALIVFGSAFNDDMEGMLRVSVVATGIDGTGARPPAPTPAPKREEPGADAAPEGTASEATASENTAPETTAEDPVAEAPSDTIVSLEDSDQVAQDALEAKAVEASQQTAFVADEPKQPKASLQSDHGQLGQHGQRANVFQEAAYENTATEATEAAKSVADDQQVAPAPQAQPRTEPAAPVGAAAPTRNNNQTAQEDMGVGQDRNQASSDGEKRSLFMRMTSGLRTSKPETPQQTPAAPSRAEPPKPQGNSNSGSQLGGMNSDERPAPSGTDAQDEEKSEGRDQLEIPSFLRRQEN